MPICYVIQESPGKNLLPAEKFGKIQVLVFETDRQRGLEHCIQVLYEKLSGYRSDKDFLILIGDPVLMGVAMIFVNQMSEGEIQLLRWDREHYCYEPVNVRIP